MTDFLAQRVGHPHPISLPGTPDELFPLFTPEGEKRWAEGEDNGQTRITLEYVYTALSEAGNAFLEGCKASYYAHFIQS